MNSRNRILAAILAVQVVVMAIVFWPESSVAEGTRLFGDLEVEQIVRLTVTDGTGQQIQLAKGPDGWGLPEADDFPTDQEKVKALLDKIAGLRADRLVTRTPDSHRRLKVADEDFERLVEFELEDGTRHQLYLGSSPRFQVLHVRADDRDEVYLVLGLSASDAGAAAAAWIDTNYFSVPSDEIVTLVLENRNGRFRFEKEEGGDWTMIDLPPGESLSQSNVNSLATRVSSLRMVRPLGREEKPSYGFDDPNAVVTVGTRDAEGSEKTFIVRVGDSPEGEQGYVVKSATSPYYVLVAEFTVSDLLEKTLEDFLQPPPTPSPDATPTP